MLEFPNQLKQHTLKRFEDKKSSSGKLCQCFCTVQITRESGSERLRKEDTARIQALMVQTIIPTH
jgi:hypothetical protein